LSDVYHSRTQPHWEIGERHDPVVWGALDGPLSTEQLSRFDGDGFVVLPGLFDAGEVEGIVAEAERLAAGASDAGEREDVITEPDSDVVRSIFRVHHNNAVFRALAANNQLCGAARQILGGDVYLHQSRINFKPGFDGRGFDWHSDFETWHIEDGMPRMRALSASVLLTDNSAVNGSLMLIRGSHRAYVRCVGETPTDHYKQSLKAQRYGVPSREALTLQVNDGGIEQALGTAGSVVLFDCNVLHGSSGNLSPYPRHNVFLVYNSVENRLVRPFGGLEPRPDFLAERGPQISPPN
jgi:ectoine hydroxylase